MNAKYVDKLIENLRRINPLATVLRGSMQAFPEVDFDVRNDKLEELLGGPEDEHAHGSEQEFPVTKPHAHHHHHHHHHTPEIVSHSFTFDKDFDADRLNHQLYVFLVLQSAGLYRLKGIIALEDSPNQHIIQSVGKRLDISAGRKWQEGEARTSVLVFIGKNLKREGIERLLEICLTRKVSK